MVFPSINIYINLIITLLFIADYNFPGNHNRFVPSSSVSYSPRTGPFLTRETSRMNLMAEHPASFQEKIFFIDEDSKVLIMERSYPLQITTMHLVVV